MITTLDDAEAQILEFGLSADIIEADGRYHRCSYMGERRQRASGFYRLQEVYRDGVFLVDGIFGSFKVSERPFQTERRVDLGYSSDKFAEIKRKAAEKMHAQNEKEKADKEYAAQRAEFIFSSASFAGNSEYLLRKKVCAFGIKFYKNVILVPMAKEGRLCSLQYITGEGKKKFLPGGDTRGVYHLITGSSKVALCEGYATGASIHMATGWTVAVCFSTNGIISAAPYFKKKDVVICADNDRKTELTTGKNPGIDAAKKAALEINCQVIAPKVDNLDHTDFNDIHVFYGIDEVKKCLI